MDSHTKLLTIEAVSVLTAAAYHTQSHFWGAIAMSQVLRHLSLFVFCTLLLAARESAIAQQTEPADFVLQSGKLFTLDAKDTQAQAVAIRDGKIVFVGSDEQARGYIGPKTDVYQAAGRTVIPGLNETHVHPTGAAQGEVTHPFMQLRSIGEIQDWVRRQVASTPSDRWIRLPRVDVTRIKERRMPTSADLDAAAGDRPAVFVWQYANRQVQVLNHAALKAASITRDTPAPKGGKIVKDSSGEPTGVIEDASSLTSKWLSRPSVSHEEYLASLEKLLRLYNRCGITSITDRGTGVDGWKAFRELQTQGRLPVRTTLTIRVGSD